MYLVLFVLHNYELVEEILSAWEQAGVSGATILHSYGLGRVRQLGLRDDFPIFPSIEQIFENQEEFSRTMFTVLDHLDKVSQVVRATQSVVGDLSKPDTGFLIVLPVTQVHGLYKQTRSEE
jgi:nitrogen regulatory protein P-II 1